MGGILSSDLRRRGVVRSPFNRQGCLPLEETDGFHPHLLTFLPFPRT